MKFFIEIVQDFDNSYYANMFVDGEMIDNLPEYVRYTTLKKAIREKTGIEIPKRNQLIFQQLHRKKFAYVDATQPCKHGCLVTLEEMNHGHKPNWD